MAGVALVEAGGGRRVTDVRVGRRLALLHSFHRSNHFAKTSQPGNSSGRNNVFTRQRLLLRSIAQSSDFSGFSLSEWFSNGKSCWEVITEMMRGCALQRNIFFFNFDDFLHR